ncbi:hypothetical protein [Acetomicrobium sp.]|uniref:hypothetical protein n=1 Tax=Acetomicrobium sp. TaxID=1872099 RepID=UPI002FCCA218
MNVTVVKFQGDIVMPKYPDSWRRRGRNHDCPRNASAFRSRLEACWFLDDGPAKKGIRILNLPVLGQN